MIKTVAIYISRYIGVNKILRLALVGLLLSIFIPSTFWQGLVQAICGIVALVYLILLDDDLNKEADQ